MEIIKIYKYKYFLGDSSHFGLYFLKELYQFQLHCFQFLIRNSTIELKYGLSFASLLMQLKCLCK